jgi:hypothetical protein
LITKPGFWLGSGNNRQETAKREAFCKTCKLARRLVDNQPGRANKSNFKNIRRKAVCGVNKFFKMTHTVELWI